MIRKPRIKPPKRNAAVDLNSLWSSKLGPAVDHIFNQKSDPLSFDELYRSCYLLVSQQQGRSLYKSFNEAVKKYLQGLKVSGDLVVSFAKLWSDYALALGLIGDVFMYLNRGFCADAKVPSVEKAGELLFRDIVLRPNSESLYNAILKAVDSERDGDTINSDDLSTVTQMLYSLATGDPNSSDNMFNEELVPLLESRAKQYYSRQLDQLIQQNLSARQIIDSIKLFTDREKEHKLYLPPKTNELIGAALDQDILPNALPKVFAWPSGLSLWIEENDLASLGLAAELESRSGAEDSFLIQTLRQVVKTNQLEYNALVQRTFDEGEQKTLDLAATEWVKNTIALKRKINDIYLKIKHYFTNAKKSVVESLNEEWSNYVNKCQVTSTKQGVSPKRSADLLAIFTDNLLKKSNTFRSEQEVLQEMDDCIVLFEAISDKEAFYASYGLKLGRRLLQKKSTSEENEQAFISKLKLAHANTSKFEIMMADADSSQQFSTLFNQTCSPAVSAKITVGRSGIWDSTYTKSKMTTLPPILDDIRAQFEAFYIQNHFKRKLTWNYKLASADIKLNIGPENDYLITLPMVCLSVLWLFQGEEELNTLQILEATGMSRGDLIPTLKCLSLLKVQRLLIKSPTGREINDTDIFKFNTEFKSPKKVIRVQLMSSSVRAENNKADAETLKKLELSRTAQIQAAVVRIMKSRKVLSHTLLVQEVVSILSSRFEAAPAMIKRSITDLIEKDYLTRDESDQDTYVYVA